MKKNCPGYTLIELLIVISLITLLFTLGIVQYNQFNRRQILVKARDELVSNLRLAQSKSLAGEKPDACGTEILTGHKLIFENDNQNYKIVAVCGNEEKIKEVSLPAGVKKQSGPDIFFKGLSQGTDITGQAQIVLFGFNETKTIIITSTGEIK